MSHESRLEGLRARMGKEAARFAEERARLQSQRRWPARLGDVFLLRETGVAPVEWLAVEQAPEDLRRLLVVAVDDNPLIGSRDVEVPAEAAAGLTSIRCDLGVWLDGKTLDPKLRTGVLDLEYVSRVRHKRQAIEDGSCTGSLLEREVDQDPEYQEWRETLAEAQTALQARSVAGAEEEGGSASFFPRSSASGPAAVAAAILLVACLGLGGTVAFQRFEIAGLERSLEEAWLPSPQLDLPFHHFTGMEPVRGIEQPLTIDKASKRVALIFEVAEPEPYPRYRLEIRESGTDREVWTGDQLTKTGSELSLDLPRSLFSSGTYVFRIYGLGEDEPELVQYTLAVELE